MSKFEHFCYLVVCRQKINLERRRALYRYNTALDNINAKSRAQLIKAVDKIDMTKRERKAYRKIADHMRKVAVKQYSPLRRELKCYVKYDSNNAAMYMHYDGLLYSYKKIEEIANSYIFETLVLKDNNKLTDPYRRRA